MDGRLHVSVVSDHPQILHGHQIENGGDGVMAKLPSKTSDNEHAQCVKNRDIYPGSPWTFQQLFVLHTLLCH